MRTDLRTLTKMSMCTALICVTAYIVFPLPFTPDMVTAQTLALSVTAYLLSPKQTLAVIAVYILIGVAGLPVFSGGTAGFGKLFGPTGGFILAWLIAFPLLSLAKGATPNFKRYFIANVLIAVPITYVGGLISLVILMDVTLLQALTMAVFPFIPGDLMKAAAAALLGVRVNLSLK